MLSFDLFPLLPPELRLRIWAFALPGPRILHINATAAPTSSSPAFASMPLTTTPPTLLSVSREARDVALMHYRRCVVPHRQKYNGPPRNIPPCIAGSITDFRVGLKEGRRQVYVAVEQGKLWCPSLDADPMIRRRLWNLLRSVMEHMLTMGSEQALMRLGLGGGDERSMVGKNAQLR